MKTIKLMMGLIAVGLIGFIAACGDDDPKVNVGPLSISGIVANGTDDEGNVSVPLNAGATANEVPLDAAIVITFSKDVDAATITATNVTLTQGGTTVPASLNTVGAVVTLTPTAELEAELQYTLTITSAVKADDGGLFTQTTRAFNTVGITFETGLVAHWMFEDNAEDLTGEFNADNSVAITYVTGRSTAAGKAASFNGTTSIVEVPNGVDLVTTNDFTLSFWVKINSDNKKVDGTTQKGYFIMGFNGFRGFQVEMPDSRANTKLTAQYVRADETKGSEDLWLDATGNLGWQGWTHSEDLAGDGGLPAFVDDQWAHFVYVYNSTTKVGSVYLNGDLMKSQDFNLWPVDSPVKTVTGLTFNDKDGDGVTVPGLGTKFAIGFYCSIATTAFGFADYSNVDHNHFKGELDDIKIYHIAKSASEVLAQYDAEKP